MDIHIGACFVLSFVLCCLAQPDLDELKQITKTEDFLRFMRKDGRPLNLTELFNSDEAREHVGGELSISNLATYDYCSPRYQTVVIPRHTDPNVKYFPPCTRVLRCGGCTPAEVLTCEPKTTSVKQVVVFKSTVPYPGSPINNFDNLVAVPIVQHDSCEPKCKIKPYNCNPLQTYIARECRCMCRSRTQCADRQVWDEDTCMCKCAQRDDNCPGFSRFSDSTCRCELRQGVSGMTDEEIRNILLLASQVTTSTSAPTTAAPTLPPLVLNLPNAPCRPLVPCPAGTTPKISPINGRCQCMLQFSFPGLPQLRRRRHALRRRQLLERSQGRF